MRWILKNERGFTLFETLISLLISSFVLLLLTGGILQVIAIRDTITSNAQESNRSDTITGDRQVEWHIFLNQLESYLQETYEPIIGQDQFEVKESVNTDRGYKVVFYRRDANRTNFSRRTDNGYQRMLTGVNNIAFSRNGGWLTLDALFVNGDRYSGIIWVESWVEQEEIEEEVVEEEETNNEVLEEEEIEDEESGDVLFEEKETENEESEEEVSEEEQVEGQEEDEAE